MERLKEELAKKRKLLEDKSLVTENRKFFKREELIRKTEEDYWKKQDERRKNKEKAESKDHETKELDDEDLVGKTPEEIAKLKLKKIIANQSSGGDNRDDSNERVLPRSEVIRRLRNREQPIILFGETELDAFRRLRKLEIQEPETSKGYTNDFQEAMEKVDAAYLEELVKSGSSSSNDMDKKRGAYDVKIEETNTNIEEILEQAQFLGRARLRKVQGDEEQRKSDCDVIVKFLKLILELWGKRLNERNEEVKRSTAGKIAQATYTQTQSYLKTLFKQLIKGTIADDILKHLILIIKCMLERNYVKASDAYLQMAIGNAPWPIGVTMVGIHARTGREKIFAQNIAHVLNDETQRKYIQGLKRLMTQCQKMFPTDPSKCVEYTKDD